jgi:hypothetical protein
MAWAFLCFMLEGEVQTTAVVCALSVEPVSVIMSLTSEARQFAV